MTTIPNLPLFLAAALLLAITPGPGIFYVAGRTLAGGRREGFASGFGTGLGGLAQVAAGTAGVSALVVASATAFSVLKLAGGLYLIYLGVQTWRLAGADAHLGADRATRGAWPAFRQGALVEATNPKTAAFFLAFLPQFITPSGNVALQFALLGVISVALNTAADLAVAQAASLVRDRLSRNTRGIRRVRQASGGLLCALGVGLALSDSRG